MRTCIAVTMPEIEPATSGSAATTIQLLLQHDSRRTPASLLLQTTHIRIAGILGNENSQGRQNDGNHLRKARELGGHAGRAGGQVMGRWA